MHMDEQAELHVRNVHMHRCVRPSTIRPLQNQIPSAVPAPFDEIDLARLCTSGFEGLGRLRPSVKLGAAPEADRYTQALRSA